MNTQRVRDVVSAVADMLRLGLTFSGRTSRAMYWSAYLCVVVALVALKAISYLRGATVVAEVLALLLAVPVISLTVRRLHDTNRSGAAIWWSLVPLVGGLVVFAWTLEPGSPGPNRYGQPSEDAAADDSSPAVAVHRRTHLDADGNLLGYSFVDDAGNPVSPETRGGL